MRIATPQFLFQESRIISLCITFFFWFCYLLYIYIYILFFLLQLTWVRCDLMEMDFIMSSTENSLTEQLLPSKHSFFIRQSRYWGCFIHVTFHISSRLKNCLAKYAALLLSIYLNKKFKHTIKRHKIGTDMVLD